MQRADHRPAFVALAATGRARVRPQAIARIENHVADLGQREDRRFIGDASHGRQIAFEPCSMHALERAAARRYRTSAARSAAATVSSGMDSSASATSLAVSGYRYGLPCASPTAACAARRRRQAAGKSVGATISVAHGRSSASGANGPSVGQAACRRVQSVDGNERLQNLCAGFGIGFEERQDRRRIGFKDQRFGPVIGFFDPGRRSAARRGKADAWSQAGAR